MMQDDASSKAGKSAASRKPTREERLKAALKANMSRRKAQARARGAGAADVTSGNAAGDNPQDKE